MGNIVSDFLCDSKAQASNAFGEKVQIIKNQSKPIFLFFVIHSEYLRNLERFLVISLVDEIQMNNIH